MIERLKHAKAAHQLAWLVLIVWSVAASLFMWQSFKDDYRHFLSETKTELKAGLQFGAQPTLTFLHFVDERCSCTRFSLPHIDEVEAQYDQVNHIRVTQQNLASMEQQFGSMDWVISSPSVAVLSEAGNLVYYGPYTNDVICGQGDDLLRVVMEGIEDQGFQWLNVLGYGCFCPWEKTVEKDKLMININNASI